MLLGVPMRVNLCSEAVTNNGSSGTALSRAFIIIEGYVYDFTPDGGSDISEYFKERNGVVGLQARFDLFGVMVDWERLEVIEEAYYKTRDDSHKLPSITDSDEKKDESKVLKVPSKEQSKVKN